MNEENINLQGKKILIADDSEVNIKLLEHLLQNTGAITIRAFNGEDVLEKIEESDIDLILMDVQMPVLNGIDATEKIREREKNKDVKIKIIAISAYAVGEEMQSAKKAGVNAYIAKPITKVKLFKEIKIVLEL